MTTTNVLLKREWWPDGETVLYSDGTKHRTGDHALLESMDLKVTDYCDMGCAFCHEMSTVKGKHAKLEDVISIFEDESRVYAHVLEIAVGGGNPMDWEPMIDFLDYCEGRYIVNATVNQNHLIRYALSSKWPNPVHILSRFKGLGISVTDIESLPLVLNMHEHSVAHVIAGVHSFETIRAVVGMSDRTLILGYKTFGRGIKYKDDDVLLNIQTLKMNLRSLLGKEEKVVAFDNLGIEQLRPDRFIKDWNSIYMGDDGIHSCYIDAVAMKQYKSSFDRSEEVSI